MKKIYLIGLANAGKSTVFNKLTNSDVRTGNWHGVTVNVSTASCVINGTKYTVCDLPGVYGLAPFSPEESVTVREVLLNPDAIFVNIIDCNNFERSLGLTLQLIELGAKVVIGLNFIEDSARRGVIIDDTVLSNILGIAVFKLSQKTAEIKRTFSQIVERAKLPNTPSYMEEWKLEDTKKAIMPYCNAKYVLYNAIRLREGAVDELWGCNVPLDIQPELRKFALYDGVKTIFSARQKIIDKILQKSLKNRPKIPYGSSKLDKIILNKYAALPVFFALMLAIFYLTFGVVGDFFSGITEYLVVDLCGGGLLKLLNFLYAPLWLVDFFNQAIIGGVGSIFGFLPQVILLMLCLEILEQSGYIARLAWLFDSTFNRIGLSGRSVFSLLMGFGCSTTAIPTTATLKNTRARTKTALLIPFMSCSAKLPVYSVIGGAFFGAGNVLVIFGLYLLGVAIALALALILQKYYPTTPSEEILEFAPMRVPNVRKIADIVGRNTVQFLSRIWTVVLGCTIIIWLCNNFTITGAYITNNTQTSILESISQILAPLFSPLGLGWGAVCALLFGLVAKELALSGIAVLNGVGGAAVAASLVNPASVVTFTPASCLAFLTFCLLYSPCISALSQLRHAVNKRVFWWYLVGQFAIAYACGALAYRLGSLIEIIGITQFIWTLFVVIFVIVCIEVLIISILVKKSCATCQHCQINRK